MSKNLNHGPTVVLPIGQYRQESRNQSGSHLPSTAPSTGNISSLPHNTVEACVLALTDRDPQVADAAARALQSLGREAIQPLLAALSTPLARPGVMKIVSQTLADLCPDSQVHRLVKDLLCGDTRAQCEAAESTGELGPDAREAIPILLWSLQRAPTTKVREAIALALERLGPVTPEVISGLAHALEGDHGLATPDTSARSGAGPVASPGLAGERKHQAETGKIVAETLGRIGTPEAVRTLLRALRGHTDPDVKRTIAKSLGAIVPPVSAAVGPLVEALNDDSPNVREAAIQALATIGEAAVAKLTTALRRESAETRARAAAALSRMVPSSLKAIAALTQALDDGDGGVAVHAAAAILKIFEANADLRAACRQKGEQARNGYVPEDERALAVLTEFVARKSGGRRDRQQAAEALGRIGVAARPASGVLAAVVADKSDDHLVRESARWALQRLSEDEPVLAKTR